MLSSTSTPIPGGYQNISALRANTMKFLPNFFSRHQLSKIFICFPDPHFKVRKHKARIVSSGLNAEYAYVLRPGGLLYTITDVEEYHHWILGHFVKRGELGEGESTTEEAKQEQDQDADDDEQDEDAGVKELWERLSDEELEADPCIPVMKEETEEGKKVTRNNGNKFIAVFRRRPDPDWLD
jgi:tRNA (guanine-N7-)-methyltransferase